MITEAQEKLATRDTRKTRNHGKGNLFISLSLGDDCNSIRVGDKRAMDECLAEAAWDGMG